MTVGLNTATNTVNIQTAAKPENKEQADKAEHKKMSTKTKVAIGVGATALAAGAIALMIIRGKHTGKETTALATVGEQAVTAASKGSNTVTGAVAEKARLEKEIKDLKGVLNYASTNPSGAGEHARPENVQKLKQRIAKLEQKLANLNK